MCVMHPSDLDAMGWDQIQFDCVGSLNSEIPTCLNSGNLNSNTCWESPPNSTFPIELIFNIPPSKIGLIEILAHEFKVPSKVVVYITNSDRWKPIGYFEFKGSFKPKSHRQREMKHVFLPITDYFYTCFKLKFYSPRRNTSNIDNQVSIYAIHIWGILQNEGIISLATNDDPLKYEDLVDSNYNESIDDERSDGPIKSNLNLKLLKESIKELDYISLLIDHESQLLNSLESYEEKEGKQEKTVISANLEDPLLAPHKSNSLSISNGTASIDELLNDLEARINTEAREDEPGLTREVEITTDFPDPYQAEAPRDVSIINLANVSDIESAPASVNRQNSWNFKSKTSSTELYCPIDVNNNQGLESLSTKETIDTCLDVQHTIYPEIYRDKDVPQAIKSYTDPFENFYQFEQGRSDYDITQIDKANNIDQIESSKDNYIKPIFLTPGPTTNNDCSMQMETVEPTSDNFPTEESENVEKKEKNFTDFVRNMMEYPESTLSSFNEILPSGFIQQNDSDLSQYSSDFTDGQDPGTRPENYYFTPKKNINYDRVSRARFEYLNLDNTSNMPIQQNRRESLKKSFSSPNFQLSSPTLRSKSSSYNQNITMSDSSEYDDYNHPVSNRIYKTPISRRRFSGSHLAKDHPTPHPNQHLNLPHVRISKYGPSRSNPEERLNRSYPSDALRSPLSERFNYIKTIDRSGLDNYSIRSAFPNEELLISNIFGDEIRQLVYSKHKGHRFTAIDNLIGAFKGHERSTIAQKGLGVIVGKSILDSSYEIADRGLEVLEELEMKYGLSRSFYQPVIQALVARIGSIPKILSDRCEDKIRNLSYTGMFDDILNFYLNGVYTPYPMGLLKIIRKTKEKQSEIRIVIVGLDNAGKSSLVANLLNHPLDKVAPTLGFKIYTYHYEKYNLNIWDIGGQKSIRSFWKNYFYKTDWLIWVIDSADRQRINDCKIEFNKLLSNQHLAETLIVILANKQDIPGAMTIDEITRVMDMDKLPNYKIIPTSAIEATGKPENLYNLLDSFKLLLGEK